MRSHRSPNRWLALSILPLSYAVVTSCGGHSDFAGVEAIDGGSGLCGNGVVDPGEACDTTALNGETCATVTLNASPGGSLACSDVCTFDMSGCQSGFGNGGTSGLGGTSGGFFGGGTTGGFFGGGTTGGFFGGGTTGGFFGGGTTGGFFGGTTTGGTAGAGGLTGTGGTTSTGGTTDAGPPGNGQGR